MLEWDVENGGCEEAVLVITARPDEAAGVARWSFGGSEEELDMA